MATLTIDSVTVNADGRTAVIKVLGTTGGGTYLFDSANAELADTSTAKVVFTVVSIGYSGTTLGTVTRTVYGTVVSRHSGVEPSGAGSWEADEDVSGSDLLITIALLEPIYQKDAAGGGNSGTAPVCRILANWYTKGADATGDTGASFPVTNNSTVAYVEPFGQWDGLPYELLQADFRMAFLPFHACGIAAVKFNALGGTSSNDPSITAVTSMSRRLCAGSGFYVNAYEATVPISGYTQGETITYRARVYPVVGDQVLDTDNYTVAGGYAILEGRGPRAYYCDKNDTVRAYGCVDSVSGNDGTGVVSTTLATAEASPYATWKAAVDAGATWIYLVDVGPHSLAARGANASASFWITTEPHPNQAGTVVCTRASNFAALRIAPCKFKNVTMKLGGALTIWDGSTNGTALCHEDCAMDDNGFTIAESDYNFDGLYFKDCVFTDLSKWITTSGGDEHRLWFDGCVGTATPNHFLRCWWRIVGCQFPGTSTRISHFGNSAELPENVLWHNSKHNNINTSNNWTTEIDAAVTGLAVAGVVCEGIPAGLAGSNLFSWVEGTQQNVNHAIFAHSTFPGARFSHFYDDGAVAQTSRHVKLVGVILHQWNCAQDLTHNTGPYPGREGRWWAGFSTQGYAIVTKDTTATSRRAWNGLGSPADGADPTYTNDLTGSTGGGDYTLQAGSVGLNILPAGSRVLAYDLVGSAIPDDGTGDAGAYQLIDPPSVTYPTPQSIQVNTAGVSIAPTSTGGAVASYAVQAGSLPTGLSLNAGTGYITGTPTVVQAAANVTIRATNAGGTDDSVISFTITAAAAGGVPESALAASSLAAAGVGTSAVQKSAWASGRRL